MLAIIKPQLQAHNHNISIVFDKVEHENVIGDSLRMQQVFLNILSNAIKYTPDGGEIKLYFTEKPTPQQNIKCFEFSCEDNGFGIADEYKDKVFEPFVRSNNEKVSKIQGTGLGMPISRNIARMMGGDITLESELGKGSKFTTSVFLKIQDTDEINIERFNGLKVLIVDDDSSSLENTCEILSSLGMKAVGVNDGEDAIIKVIESHKSGDEFYAAIVDWKMPGMDGLAVTKAIREKVSKEIPIIIISAYDWNAIENEAREAGVNDFISKPIFRSRLIHIFDKLLSSKDKKENPVLSKFDEMDLSGHKVLLAEDNELNAEIATEILKMTGVDVEWANDGDVAVDLMQKRESGYYDIIFMDIQMPNMNGYEATQAIRALDNPYCKKIPIIAMTANAFADDVNAALNAGMNEHIAKPLDFNVLAKTLSKYIINKACLAHF